MVSILKSRAVADIYLGIGTNLGNRERNIKIALNLLDLYLGTHYKKISEIVETEAVGFEGPNFLNCVVRYSSSKNPHAILAICKRIESEMGRKDDLEYDTEGRRVYHDRIIDIDILKAGNLQVFSPTLVIPHPQIEERAFVKPLLESVTN